MDCKCDPDSEHEADASTIKSQSGCVLFSHLQVDTFSAPSHNGATNSWGRAEGFCWPRLLPNSTRHRCSQPYSLSPPRGLVAIAFKISFRRAQCGSTAPPMTSRLTHTCAERDAIRGMEILHADCVAQEINPRYFRLHVQRAFLMLTSGRLTTCSSGE